jgi:hypothetical protein
MTWLASPPITHLDHTTRAPARDRNPAVKSLVLFCVLVLTVPLTAHAQAVNFGTLDDDTNVVTVTAGAEHGLVVGAGYARVLSIAGHPILVGGDLTLGGAEIDVGDFRVRAGALVPLAGTGNWKVLGGLTAVARGTENDLGRMTNVGADVALLGGRYIARGFFAAELGADWAIATHVSHGETYRMTVYADARDGWYGNTGAMLRAGGQAGVSFGRHDIILRAGRLVDISGESPLFPFYGTLTFDTRW